MQLTPVQKIRLLLADVDASPIYLHRAVSDDSGLQRIRMLGDLAHPTALAIRNLILGIDDDATRAAAEKAIVTGVVPKSAELVGALAVELALYKRFPTEQEPIALSHVANLARGLTFALGAVPEMPTEQELDSIIAWVAMVSNSPFLQRQLQRVSPDGISLGLLTSKVQGIQRSRLQSALLGQPNPIIDRDRRELVDRLGTLAVDEDIRRLLDAADRDAASGDFKGALEKCRTFLERTYESCCRRHAPGVGAQPLPEKSAGGSIAPWLQWATKAGLLKQKEHDVVQALSSFLAMEGSHAPSSEPRQYVVARATVIEWCLLVADRVS